MDRKLENLRRVVVALAAAVLAGNVWAAAGADSADSASPGLGTLFWFFSWLF